MRVHCKRLFINDTPTEGDLPEYAARVLGDAGIGLNSAEDIWVDYVLHLENVGDFWSTESHPGCNFFHRELQYVVAVNIPFDEMIKMIDLFYGNQTLTL